jgi:hypothetical protein
MIQTQTSGSYVEKMDIAKKPEYLISKGVVNLLENRYDLALTQEVKERINSLETEFTERLGEELSDVFDYKVISAEKIEESLEACINNSATKKLPTIGLDDVYFKNIAFNGSISITRLVNDINNFSNKTLGPRKGNKDLAEQVKGLEENYSGKEIALADIGVFEGETLFSEKNGLLNLLREKGITVKRFYAAILNKSTIKKFEKAGVEVISGQEYDFEGGDWLEVRDLLGLDGRKINTDKYLINNGTNLFARYIQDPQTLKSGASINDGVTASIVLDLCNMYQKKILREIRKSGYQIVEGFVNSDPRLYTLEFKKTAKIRT